MNDYIQLLHNAVYFSSDVYWDTAFCIGKQSILHMWEKFTGENHWRMSEMAAKKSSSSVQTPSYEAIKWVNRNLSESEKKDHDANTPKPADLFKDLLALCTAGYNIAVKWDSYSKCFQSTLLPYETSCPNYGYGLSARATTPQRAVSLLLYKHFVVLGENWVAHYTLPTSSFEG